MVGVIIAVALVLLITQNGEKTHIDWLAFDFEAPLWIVLLLSAAAGAIVWESVKFALRRRRRATARARD